MPLSTSVCCSALPSETHYNTLPSETHYNTLQHTEIAQANANRRYPPVNVCVLQCGTVRETLQHTATLCNTLQRTSIEEDKRQIKKSPLPTSVYCSVLQSEAHCNTLQHTTTHCNTLQHTATHCNTLLHTATTHLSIQNL